MLCFCLVGARLASLLHAEAPPRAFHLVLHGSMRTLIIKSYLDGNADWFVF